MILAVFYSGAKRVLLVLVISEIAVGRRRPSLTAKSDSADVAWGKHSHWAKALVFSAAPIEHHVNWMWKGFFFRRRRLHPTKLQGEET